MSAGKSSSDVCGTSHDLMELEDNYLKDVDCIEFRHGLPAAEVHKRLIAAGRLFGKARSSLALWIVEMGERKLYREFGCSSVYQYAERYLSLEGHTVNELLRTGKALLQLPLLSQAYENGQISSTHVKEISRVVNQDTERLWLEAARSCTTRQIQKLVAFTPRGGIPVATKAGEKAEAQILSTREVKSGNSESHPGEKPGKSVTDATMGNNEVSGDSVQHDSNTVMVTDSETGSGKYGGLKVEQQMKGGGQFTGGNPVKYHDKLIVDLTGEQMAIIRAAIEKARKESGLRDRASLIEYIARVFLEDTGRERIKGAQAPYQIVLHHHPLSGITWCESVNGERYVASPVFEKALCDTEVVEVEDVEAAGHFPSSIEAETTSRGEDPVPQSKGSRRISDPMGYAAGSGCAGDPTMDAAGPQPTSSPVAEAAQIMKEKRIQNDTQGGPARDWQEVAQDCDRAGNTIEYINSLYRSNRERARENGKNVERNVGAHCNVPLHRRTRRTISASLKKKVILRDGGCCQAPGCRRRDFIQIHHIDPAGAGGKHSFKNCLCLCIQCHTLVHEGKLRIEGEAPNALTWRDGSGKILAGSAGHL